MTLVQLFIEQLLVIYIPVYMFWKLSDNSLYKKHATENTVGIF